MARRSRSVSLIVGLMAMALLLACATPPNNQEETGPRDVVRAFLEAQRMGKAVKAADHWGFSTNEFQSVGGSPAEAAMRADIRRRADSGLPREFAIGETQMSPENRDRAFVQVWVDRPQQGPASLYELVRTRDGWKIVSFSAAPEPPRQ